MEKSHNCTNQINVSHPELTVVDSIPEVAFIFRLFLMFIDHYTFIILKGK
jgi:hypothetical protein